jgi:hypothetical protein
MSDEAMTDELYLKLYGPFGPPLTPDEEHESTLIDALLDKRTEAEELYGDGCDERHIAHCAEADAAWQAWQKRTA